MYMAVASPSVSGLVAMMTSWTPPLATRSTRDLMARSSGPTWFMGEITPWSTWYWPLYSRLRSMAATSLGSATTQMVDGSRLGDAQMGHRPPAVKFWQTGQQVTLRLASTMASAKAFASSSGRPNT